MSKRSLKRIPGSLKIWWNEKNNTVWASIDVHTGRTTNRVRGPEARDMDTAIEMLKSNLEVEEL